MKRILGAIIGVALAAAVLAAPTPASADTWVIPVAPTWHPAGCDDDASVDIPAATGLDYTLDTVLTPAGSYLLEVGAHEVVATAQPGYMIPYNVQNVWDFTVDETVGPCPEPAQATSACVAPGCDSGWATSKSWNTGGYGVWLFANERVKWRNNGTRDVLYSGHAWYGTSCGNDPTCSSPMDEVRIWARTIGGTWTLKKDDNSPPPIGYYKTANVTVAFSDQPHEFQARMRWATAWQYSPIIRE